MGGGNSLGPPAKPHATGRTGATTAPAGALPFATPFALPAGLPASSLGATFLFASPLGFATAGGRGAKARSSGTGALLRIPPTALAASLPLAAHGPNSSNVAAQVRK